MIEYVIFNDKIDKESISLLMKDIKDVYILFQNNPSKDNVLIIYFTSSGGNISYSDYLIDYINNLNNVFKIKLICSDFILSCGLYIPLNFNGEVIITESCYGMIHLPYIDVDTNSIIKKNQFGNFIKKELKNAGKKELEKFKDFLTEKEKIKYFQGEDIFISNERLQTFFNKRK